MKRIICVILLISLLVSLISCGKSEEISSVAEISESSSVEASNDELSSAGEESVIPDESSEAEDNMPEALKSNIYYNVARGKHYTAEASNYRTDSFGDSDDESGNNLRYKLTDGEVAESGSSGKIAGYGCGEATFTVDLEKNYLIKYISCDVYGDEWGVSSPYYTVIDYSVSEDNVNFNPLSTVSVANGNVEITSVGDWNYGLFTANCNENTTARYVKIHITLNGVHIWMSEITVNGKAIESDELNYTIPCILITTKDNDRVHRSSFHECDVQIYDPSHTFKLFSEKASIKIRGNSTSSGEKAPYNIKFEKSTSLLGLGKSKKWYLIANMYDKTQLRNKLAFDLADNIGMDYVQQTQFVELYLNGEYRGMYMLCESIGVGNARVDLDLENNEYLLEYEPWPQYANEEWIETPKYNIILGLNDPEHITEEQQKFLKEFFTSVENAIASKDYDEICKYIDVNSFIDAFIVQEFFKQVDYATSSTRFYIKDGKLYEGPVWDFDLSAGNCSSSYYVAYNNMDTTGISWQGDYCYGIWNSRLFKCEKIWDMMVERYKELQPYLVNVYEDNELGTNQIDLLLAEYQDDIDKNYNIWSTSAVYSALERVPTDGTYASEIDYLRDWFKNRNAWLLERFGIAEQ